MRPLPLSARMLAPALFLVALLAACATKIPVRILRPAEVSLGGVRDVAVLDFRFEGRHKDELDPRGFLESLVGDIVEDALGVGDPDPDEYDPGTEFSDALAHGLLENAYYNVLAREELQRVLDEHALVPSGFLDVPEAAQLGELLPVGVLIMGEGKFQVSDDGDWEEYTEKKKDGTEVKKKRFKADREVETELEYRAVDAGTGAVLAARTLTRTGNASSIGTDASSAQSSLRDWSSILEEHVEEMVREAVNQLAPHYVEEKRQLRDGKIPALKAGAEYAKRDLWDEARLEWESVLAEGSGAREEDRVAAVYNLGIYHEIHGNLDEAEHSFEQCYEMSGDADFLDAKARVRLRRDEIEALRAQEAL